MALELKFGGHRRCSRRRDHPGNGTVIEGMAMVEESGDHRGVSASDPRIRQQ